MRWKYEYKNSDRDFLGLSNGVYWLSHRRTFGVHMRGISEERLKEIGVDLVGKEAKDLIVGLINECKELTPWQPISTAPKDRRILLFYSEHKVPEGHMESLIVASKYDALATIMYQPTHWSELPPNPELPEDPRE